MLTTSYNPGHFLLAMTADPQFHDFPGNLRSRVGRLRLVWLTHINPKRLHAVPLFLCALWYIINKSTPIAESQLQTKLG